MKRAAQIGERKAGVELDPEGDRVDPAVGRVQHRRGDVFGVFGGPDDGGPAAFFRPCHSDGAGDVARRHHHGEAQPELAVIVTQGLLIAQLHRDRVTRADIGHRVGEDVGPVLLHQRGVAAFAARLLVCPPRRPALLDARLDDPVADAEPHLVDRGVLGQGKDVHPFEPGPGRIVKLLAQTDARHHTADAYLHFGGEQRRRSETARIAGPEQQAAAADLVDGGQNRDTGGVGRSAPCRGRLDCRGHDAKRRQYG